jgi:hypothetical protein
MKYGGLIRLLLLTAHPRTTAANDRKMNVSSAAVMNYEGRRADQVMQSLLHPNDADIPYESFCAANTIHGLKTGR